MNKYIIKNCPAYIHRPLSTHDRVCLLGDKVKPHHKELYVYCQDCTDCVMKQIVELLQQYDKENFNWCEPISFNTENIYELLKIQEVE